MLKRGWLSSCKFQDKIVFNSNYIFIWNWSNWRPPLPPPRKSDTVLGTEESCLALATGLWQDETVSKKRNIFFSLVVIYLQKVWNDISCYHEKEWICEDSEKLLKKMGLAWTFGGQKKMDMHKFFWQGFCSLLIQIIQMSGFVVFNGQLGCLTKQKTAPPHNWGCLVRRYLDGESDQKGRGGRHWHFKFWDYLKTAENSWVRLWLDQ